MRLYHNYYRQKNPSRKSSPLTGEKAKLYRSISRSLARPIRNPEIKSGKRKHGDIGRPDPGRLPRGRYRDVGLPEMEQAIRELSDEEYKSLLQSYSTLIALNTLVAQGEISLIPLRDTVQARVDGYLTPEVMKYSVQEAVRGLRKREVQLAGKRIKQIQKLDLPPMVMYHRVKLAKEEAARASRLDPKARRLRRQIADINAGVLELEGYMRRRGMGRIDYFVGPERVQEMKEQDAEANKILGTIKLDSGYQPADEDLFKKALERVKKKARKVPYAEGMWYVVPLLESVAQKDLRILRMLGDLKTTDAQKKKLLEGTKSSPGFAKVLQVRFNNRAITEYEKMGGRPKKGIDAFAPLAPGQHVSDVMRLGRGRTGEEKRQLGKPFQVKGTSYWAVVSEHKDKFAWRLLGKTGTTYFRGVANTRSGATKAVGITARIMKRLEHLGEASGWGALGDEDQRWLEKHKPLLSKEVGEMMVRVMPTKISTDTARWIMSATNLEGRPGVRKRAKGPERRGSKEREEMSKKKCEALKNGESTTIRGRRGAYVIHIEKSRGKYKVCAIARSGERSRSSSEPDCGDAITKGHALGGALTGALKVVKAIGNPASLKRLENSATKYFRKQNPPRIPRKVAQAATIQELAGMMGIPGDPEEAYRYGFYAGIIRGIDTCGVQNWAKRKRIRKKYEQALLDAATGVTARLTEPPARERASSRIIPTSGSTTSEEDVINELLYSMEAD